MEFCREPKRAIREQKANSQIYWFVSGYCISAYTTGSSLLAYGACRSELGF